MLGAQYAHQNGVVAAAAADRAEEGDAHTGAPRIRIQVLKDDLPDSLAVIKTYKELITIFRFGDALDVGLDLLTAESPAAGVACVFSDISITYMYIPLKKKAPDRYSPAGRLANNY